MENDIVVNKSVFKTIGSTVVKSVAIAAGVTIGVALAQKAMGKSTDNS